MKFKTRKLKTLLKKLGDVNDSYEDILWQDLEGMTEGEANTLTVKEWLEMVLKSYEIGD
jgi:hypothetical protein